MNNDNKKIFANNLKYYMDQKRVDRYKLCEDLKFKYSTVSEWLNAKKIPRVDKIAMLANYFNIAMSNLLEEHPLQANQKINVDFINSIFNAKKEAPTDEDDRGKKIKNAIRDIASLDDAGLDAVLAIISILVVFLKSKSNAKE